MRYWRPRVSSDGGSVVKCAVTGILSPEFTNLGVYAPVTVIPHRNSLTVIPNPHHQKPGLNTNQRTIKPDHSMGPINPVPSPGPFYAVSNPSR
jgi:hypothetical protein